MNKKELIEKIEALPISYSWDEPYLNKEVLLEVIKQLDEPKKVKVPQFVADWYEERKKNIDFEIWHYLHTFDSQKEDEFKKWMNKLGKKQIQILVSMHRFGYEVEKEPKYIVRLKNTRFLYETLNFNKQLKQWYFSDSSESTSYRIKHTRKQLEEAGFGWVFDCEGIEIEEVTE